MQNRDSPVVEGGKTASGRSSLIVLFEYVRRVRRDAFSRVLCKNAADKNGDTAARDRGKRVSFVTKLHGTIGDHS